VKLLALIGMGVSAWQWYETGSKNWEAATIGFGVVALLT
jgi:hypothetical protein